MASEFNNFTGVAWPGEAFDHLNRIERPGFIAPKMRIVFMGTPDFAARILQILLTSSPFAEVVAVYSRPDAVSKRGNAAVPSAVSALALENDLPLFRPQTLRDTEVQQQLRDLRPDLIVVAAYGMILPREVLDIPPRGCVNVHASLLPRWRGAAPIERAILEGDARTGVCIMQMEEGLDTGPYCAYESTDIGEKTAAELRNKLADMGGRLLVNALPALLGGSAQWTVQNEDEVTYAHKIEKDELKLSPELSVTDFMRRVRASSDSAPARLSVEDKGVTVLDAAVCRGSDKESCAQSSYRVSASIHCPSIAERAEDPSSEPLLSSSCLDQSLSIAERTEHPPSELLPLSGEARLIKHQGKRSVLVGCADGAVELLKVKPDSKRAMAATDWINGFPDAKKGLSWD